MAEPPHGIPGIDVELLADWLAGVLPEAGDIVDVELIAGGRSNLTYRIVLSGPPGEVVLRRPPLGHVLPTAHDMAREHRVLTGLSRITGQGRVPVPRPIALCTDEAVLGVPFYVMEYVEGDVLRTADDGRAVTPEMARTLSEQLADNLAAIHRTDLAAAGLTDFGRPNGYMERQLARWMRQWDASRAALRAGGAARDLPGYDVLVERLTERLPEATAGGPSGLVHGDFRLDNALVRLAPRPEIAAIVDWEMSTLGDPLADLGLTLTYWVEAGDQERLAIPVGSTITTAPGFFTAREFAARYAATGGYDLGHLDFYVAFGCFKLAVVAEGINARYQLKQTVGEGFAELAEGVPILIDRALRILDAGPDGFDARP
jgi:aminoglycoside phosphotransferase (APT) family kinase protein